MPSGPEAVPTEMAHELLRHAAAILSREAQRLPTPVPPRPAERSSPAPLPAPPRPAAFSPGDEAPAAMAPIGSGTDDLRRQAEALLGDLLSAFGADPKVDRQGLLRQGRELFESLLSAFRAAPGGGRVPAEDSIPLLRCEAPVAPGNEARAFLVVSNDEATPSDVSLYCTTFVADSGHDISPMRISFSPRRATIAPGGEATFQIGIAISEQAPAGIYSGLLQAAGARYVKAVLSVEVT